MTGYTIAQKNDLARTTFFNCRVVVSEALSRSPKKEDVITAVREFNAFTPDNDPHGEHDCAFFEVDGERFFFKFDYYDENYEFYQEDGKRVLTIGFASDY
jgi:hypothetical protein